MEQKRILITGANGQLGKAVVRSFEEQGINSFVAASHADLDITDFLAVEDYLKSGCFTHIINCAAYTAVDKAEQEELLCNRINADGPRNLAIISEKHKAHLIHISTDYVFDGFSNIPYTETSQTNPLSVYGLSKLTGEVEIQKNNPSAIILRTGWLYDATSGNFLNTMLRMANSGKRLRVVCDQMGTPTFAGDLADAIVNIVVAGKWNPGVYHYSNEGVASWYDFAVAIFEESGLSELAGKVEPIMTEDYPTAAIRPHYSVLDKRKIKSTFGLQITHWRDALRRCLSTK